MKSLLIQIFLVFRVIDKASAICECISDPTDLSCLPPQEFPEVGCLEGEICIDNLCFPATDFPTKFPTPQVTQPPTPFPTPSPTSFPTLNPTKLPTLYPTLKPTQFPSSSPTEFSTDHPSIKPTIIPTGRPSEAPTLNSNKQSNSRSCQWRSKKWSCNYHHRCRPLCVRGLLHRCLLYGD